MAGILKYGNDYLVKTGSGGRNSSGPSGRRKMRGRNIMAQNLADAASKYGIVLWCSDQHRNHGTGTRSKFYADNHSRISAALADVQTKAIQGMRMEHVQ
jgi:hypothetical protein